jgi:hypothetical protein
LLGIPCSSGDHVREGGSEEGREGEREGGREGGREGEREGGLPERLPILEIMRVWVMKSSKSKVPVIIWTERKGKREGGREGPF